MFWWTHSYYGLQQQWVQPRLSSKDGTVLPDERQEWVLGATQVQHQWWGKGKCETEPTWARGRRFKPCHPSLRASRAGGQCGSFGHTERPRALAAEPWALWTTAWHFSRFISLLFSNKPSFRGTPCVPSGNVSRPTNQPAATQLTGGNWILCY